MNTTALKIVVDTNILVAIIGKKSPFRWIFDCLINGKLALCVSTEILLEYQEILEQKNGDEVAENVVNFINVSPYTHKAEIYYNFNLIINDEDDNKFVDCAVASNAICLVSNDSDLKPLLRIDFPKINLLTLFEFEKQYKNILLDI
ncbi:MAG: putative toxin-antitoxin system toxin component, PIN family [Arcicella sp.]|nr:putative toxin-antitoxin system toxin component, PIN family [Arcicella sp.]